MEKAKEKYQQVFCCGKEISLMCHKDSKPYSRQQRNCIKKRNAKGNGQEEKRTRGEERSHRSRMHAGKLVWR